jgi:hypothetical protein
VSWGLENVNERQGNQDAEDLLWRSELKNGWMKFWIPVSYTFFSSHISMGKANNMIKSNIRGLNLFHF